MPLQRCILVGAEASIIALSFYVGAMIRYLGDLEVASRAIGDLMPRAMLYASLVLLAMLSVGLYRTGQRKVLSETTLRVGAALVLAGLANAIFSYSMPGLAIGRGALALSLLATFPFVLLVRVLFDSLVDDHRLKRNILVLGRDTAASSFKRFCDSQGQSSFRVIGYLPVEGEIPQPECAPVILRSESLINLVRTERVDEIVVAMNNRRNCFPARQLLDCRLDGVRVTDSTTFLERETGKINVDSVRTSWLIFGNGFRQGTSQRALKRAFDIIASLVLLICSIPILTVVAVAILVEGRGRGPIFYRQVRVGLRGETFNIYKLRSMVTDAEQDGARWAASIDPRVTRVGAVIRRMRIDELPQIINILKGEMSFVGPRPERPEFVKELTKNIPYYQERHCVKPGLTGWAQLCYPYGASIYDAKQKLQYDLYYAKNRSMMFDLLILLQTLDVVIWARKHPGDSAVRRTGSRADQPTPQALRSDSVPTS